MERYFQWMVMHKWMTGYTQQTEWIQRQGILVWLAEVFTSLGSGLYLISLLLFSLHTVDIETKKLYLIGAFIAWIFIMFFKIPMHLAYFGKPLRFWRTIPPFSSAWKTSWFARGIIFSILFGTFGFLQVVISWLVIDFNFAFLLPLDIILRVLGGLTALLSGIYPGFIMNFVKAIPFWNTALMPVVLILGGVLDGCALLMAIPIFGGRYETVAFIETISTMLLVLNIFLIAVFLLGGTYSGAAAKESVNRLVRGSVAPVFWIGLVGLGMLIPLVLSIYSLAYGEGVNRQFLDTLLIIGIVSHTVGAFTLKYCILKVGIYRPLVAVNV